MHRRVLPAAIAAAALFLGACGSGDSNVATDTPSAVGEPTLFEFTGTDINGNDVDVSTYAGSDIVVWFWAPW